jgi:glycosyltransferase involved in cell wall biosynthesis
VVRVQSPNTRADGPAAGHTISVIVPCFNDVESLRQMHARLTTVFQEQLPDFDYEIIFSDNASTDGSRAVIQELCQQDSKVKGVFNARNFGFHRNVFEALAYGSGDASFLIFGDLQDSPELLPAFVEEWASGHSVVIGQRRTSRDKFFMRQMRRLYYQIIERFSDTPQIANFNGFGLYDRRFIDAIERIDDIQPYLKAVIGEYAMNLGVIQYDQAKSNRGRSNFSFLGNYDFAMQGITSSTKLLMRMATFVAAIIGLICLGIAIFVLVSKLIHWTTYPIGQASITVGIFFLGAVQLFFIGILGEYILSINTRTSRRPRVLIERTLNFPPDADPALTY